MRARSRPMTKVYAMLSRSLRVVPFVILTCCMPVALAHAQQCRRQCKVAENRDARGCCIPTATQPKKSTPLKNTKRSSQRGRPPQPDRPPPQAGPNTPTSHGDSSSQGLPPNGNPEHPGTLNASVEGAKSIARQAEPAPPLQEPDYGGKASGQAAQPQRQQTTTTLTGSGEAIQPQKLQTTPTTTEISEATRPQGQQVTTTLTESGEEPQPQKQQTTTTTTEPREATQPQRQETTTTPIGAKGQAREPPAVQASRPAEQQGMRTRNYGATTAFVDVIVAGITILPSVSNDNYLLLGLGYTFSGQLAHTFHGNFGTGWLSALNRLATPLIFAGIGSSLRECDDEDCDEQERWMIGGAVIGVATALSLDWFALSRDQVKVKAGSKSAFLPVFSPTRGGWIAGLAKQF
jgi:hypothetical protein